MKHALSLGFIALALGLLARPISAGTILVSAVETSHPDVTPGLFDYSIVVSNSAASTDTIGTFWFSWVPGKDFMINNPVSVSSPAGWAGIVTHVPPVPTNGYAIQWVSSTAATTGATNIPIGGSLTFGFVSAETPAQLAGNSALYPTTPELTSVVYSGRPFVGDTVTFQVTTTPEPSSLVLGLIGAIGTLGYAVRRRRKLAS